LRKILLAGTKAPSAVNSQPWEFIVVEDQNIIEKLAEIKYRQSLENPPQIAGDSPDKNEQHALAQKRSFQNAAIVAICHKVEWERSVWLCIENIALAAVSEGLGSGIVLYWGDTRKEAEKVLGLPEEYELTALLKIGVPAEEGYPRDRNPYNPRRPEFSWLHKNRF
jgi:nitroreductase